MAHLVFKVIATLTLTLFLSACQIEGETETAAAAEALRNAEPNSAFIYRDSGFHGSAINLNIYIDGETVGKVGNKRFLEFRIPTSSKLMEIGISTSSEPGWNTASIDLTGKANKPRYFLATGDFSVVPLIVVTIMESNLYLLEVDRQTFLSQLP